MSRSYRKGGQCAGDKSFKKIFNRKLRRNESPENTYQYGGYKKLNNAWDIADYHYTFSWNDFKKWHCNKDLSEKELRGEFNRQRSK